MTAAHLPQPWRKLYPQQLLMR